MIKFWSELSDREQFLMGLCLASAIMFLLYVSVVDPVLHKKRAAQRALDVQKQTYERVLNMATEEKMASYSNGAELSERLPIREAATTAARSVGIAISRIQPGPDESVTFWIDEANTMELSNWLLILKNEYHWPAAKVSLNKNLQGDTLRGQFEFVGVVQ